MVRLSRLLDCGNILNRRLDHREFHFSSHNIDLPLEIITLLSTLPISPSMQLLSNGPISSLNFVRAMTRPSQVLETMYPGKPSSSTSFTVSCTTCCTWSSKEGIWASSSTSVVAED